MIYRYKFTGSQKSSDFIASEYNKTKGSDTPEG